MNGEGEGSSRNGAAASGKDSVNGKEDEGIGLRPALLQPSALAQAAAYLTGKVRRCLYLFH